MENITPEPGPSRERTVTFDAPLDLHTQTATPESGLEVDRRAPPQRSPWPKPPDDWGATSTDQDERGGRIFGLRRRVFWACLDIALVVILVGVLGGVLGGVLVRNSAKNANKETETSSGLPPTDCSPLSSPASSHNTTSPTTEPLLPSSTTLPPAPPPSPSPSPPPPPPPQSPPNPETDQCPATDGHSFVRLGAHFSINCSQTYVPQNGARIDLMSEAPSLPDCARLCIEGLDQKGNGKRCVAVGYHGGTGWCVCFGEIGPPVKGVPYDSAVRLDLPEEGREMRRKWWRS